MTESSGPQDYARTILARAHALGFTLVGITDARCALDDDHARYRDALDAGLHGPISYLAKNVEARRRVDDEHILPGARSVIVVATRYDRPDDALDPPIAQRIARYARGHDYHNTLRKRLRKLAAFVRTLATSVEARPMSDTAPVLEKAWAARAGLGFVGKNGLIIAPGQGSYLLLGEVVTTLELAEVRPFPGASLDDRCGSCSLCLDACPTGAFVRPFVLDAGKCISTMTIELTGPIPEPVRQATAGHLFGCDVCQEVCPYNGKSRPMPPLGSQYRPHERWASTSLEQLARLGMDGAQPSDALLSGTPLSRAGEEGIARNACLALEGAQGDHAREVLREVSASHPSDVVRDAARWALGRMP